MIAFTCSYKVYRIFTIALLILQMITPSSSIFVSRRLFGRTRQLHLSALSSPSSQTFRTEVADKIGVPWKISYQSKLFFIGSCFSENISSRLVAKKFSVQSNPQGILFNPISIEKCVSDIVSGNPLNELEDVYYDEKSKIYHAWDAHSDFSSIKKDEVINKINSNRLSAGEFLRQASVAFITLGTAKVHTLSAKAVQTGRIVANCHKQPGTMFTNRILSYEEISQSLNRTLLFLRTYNPTIQVVFTISPVRHTRDTMIVNSLSKSLLLASVHQIVQQHKEYASYFPSYEYVMDELRDYRWYADDMIHPSTAAVDFIFEHFRSKYMSEETTMLLKKIDSLVKNLQHRPRFIASPTYHQHLKICQVQLEEVNALLLKQNPAAVHAWEEERKLIETSFNIASQSNSSL